MSGTVLYQTITAFPGCTQIKCLEIRVLWTALNKSNSEVPISGKQLEIIAVRFGFDKPVVNQYSFSNGQRRYLEDILECLNIKNINSEGRNVFGVLKK